MIYNLLIWGISIWLIYDIFLMHKAKNKSQVLIESILLVILIAGYLIINYMKLTILYQIHIFIQVWY